MTVYLDISQLLQDPRRSGIQRVERELIRLWPGPARLAPCRFDPVSAQMRELPAAVFDMLCADTGADGLHHLLAEPGPEVPGTARLLSAELFADPARAAFYRSHGGARAFWLVYDFLPWLQPQAFPAGPALALMPYLRALRTVPHLAFISAATKRECEARILRRPCPGPVIGLGADGLGLQRQRFHPARRGFLILGTIEPRKNVAAALRAFRQLWSDGVDAGLILIGRLEPDAIEEHALLHELRTERCLQHLPSASDQEIRAALAGVRALLFPSAGEGYGLPPTEALHAGMPVIVAKALPALIDRPRAGQVRLPSATPDAIADAVRTLLDDSEAARLWSEASKLEFPTWRDFARTLAEWVQSTSCCRAVPP